MVLAYRISDALQVAIDLFCKQLQLTIREGDAKPDVLISLISTLDHLDPFQTTNDREYGFLWLTDILNSGYPGGERREMASGVVRLLGKHFDSRNRGHFSFGWISPLLGFLSLCEEFGPSEGSIALRILSYSPPGSDSGAMILPVLTPILLPTHPLRSRGLALSLFRGFMSEWFSSQIGNVLHRDLDKFLQAVGDPFQPPHTPLRKLQPADTNDYEPMLITTVLIEFASSDSWRNHLRHSNFTSCEGILSTEEGRRTALISMFDTATHSWPEFLCTPAKIIAAIQRLEELQCLKTGEAVILWAWTVGVVNATDRDSWGVIERGTLNFYRTHGIRRLTALSRHITDTTMEIMHMKFLLVHYQGQPCRVGSVQQLVPFERAVQWLSSQHFEDLRVAQVSQLRRLYHLFGYDPTTWKEAVGVEEADDAKMDVQSGPSVSRIRLTDWACDYP